MHPANLPTAVTHTRDFEAAELETNHVQAINLVINGSSELDSKLKQFMMQPMYQTPTPVYQTPIYQPQPQVIYQPQPQIIYQSQPIQTLPQNPAQITLGNPQSRVTQNWRLVMVVYQLVPNLLNPQSGSCPQNLDTGHAQNPNSQHYLSLLVTPEDATSNKLKSNQQLLTNTIPPTTISNDKFLAAIFSFELKETTPILLFSRATFEEKPITVIYTDARVDGYPIKLILDSGSAGSIITRQLMDQLGCQVDQAASARIITADGATKTPISKINDIMTPIKVLVIEATQYQTLISNDWLFKVNAMLDWNTQELQLTYQSQYIHVPAMCGHFKTLPREKLLIKLEKAKEKPTWEAYQVSRANANHNELPPILSWDDKEKKNLLEEQIRNLGMMTAKANQPQNGLGKRKKKGKNKKKSQHNLLPLHMSYILHNFRPPTVDLNSNASLAARNCQQWAHVVAITKTGRQQHNIIVTHVSLNVMADH
ncbi:hypothetical protein G9A89_007986 [Geosiphon pyriformis]|nr:hypothetical protein G9A89_007986 [Geosiphon pyriformis]